MRISDWSSDVCSSDLPCQAPPRGARSGKPVPCFASGMKALGVLRQPQPCELPALVGIEEVAVGRADMAGRGDAGTAAQSHLVAHELAVVLANRARRRAEAGIGLVGALRPFPDVPDHLAGADHLRRTVAIVVSGDGMQ